jgi:protein-S-isoprenylcysteine O-methyltransferase Ste14
MAGVYLVLLVGWLVIVGVVRGVAHQRSTGTVPLRFGDRRGSPQWWARLLGSLGFLLAVAAPLADVVGLEPLDALDDEGVAVAGMVLVIVGVIGTVAGQVAMGDSWRADVDPDLRTDLVVTGPFRWVRNPIAVCTVTTTVGLALVVPNVLAAGMVVFSVASSQLQVRLVEEPYLERVHRRGYVSYAERTGRFLPGIGRL